MEMITKEDIEQAHARIKAYVHRTPVMTSAGINEISDCELFFKCENLQKVGAFKARGATNAALQLSAEQRAKGIATHRLQKGLRPAAADTVDLVGFSVAQQLPAAIGFPQFGSGCGGEGVPGDTSR